MICETGMPAFVATDGSFQHSRKIIRRLARDFKGRTAQSRSTRKTFARHNYPWHNCIANQTLIQFWTKYSVQRWKGEPNRNSFPIVLVWPDIKPIEQNKITPRLSGRVDRVDRLANLSSVRCQVLSVTLLELRLG